MRQFLVLAVVLGAWQHTAHACPDPIPRPSTETDIQCYTIDKPVNVRCATAINPTVCSFLNNTALNEGLVTQGGFNYLGQIGFCAIVNNLGDGDKIYDFCPVGCFAADTQMLTGMTLEGRLSYALAAALKPQGTLISMTDGASLDDVVLGPQHIKRTVYGPETQPLYVFALSNGQTLKVTQHHPMVLDSGKIVEAQLIAPGMSFVGLDGEPVAVAAVGRERATSDVFNFETTSSSALGHIIVAEGVLVGDLKLQNELADEGEAIGLRR